MNILQFETTNASQARESLAVGLATTGGGEDAASGSFESVLLAASPAGFSIQARVRSQKGGATLAKPDARSGDAPVTSTQSAVPSTATGTENSEISDLTGEANSDAPDENVSKKQENGQLLLGESDWGQLAAAQSLQSVLNLAIPSVAVVSEPSKSKDTSTSAVAGVGAVGAESRGAGSVEKLSLRFSGASSPAVPTGKLAIAGPASSSLAPPQPDFPGPQSSDEKGAGASVPIIALGMQGPALPDEESAGQTPAIVHALAGNSPVQPRLNPGPSSATDFGSVSFSQTELPSDFPSQSAVQPNSQSVPAASLETPGRLVQQSGPVLTQTASVAVHESAQSQKFEAISTGFPTDHKARSNEAGNSSAPEIQISGAGVWQSDSKPASQDVAAFAPDQETASAVTEQPVQNISARDSSGRIPGSDASATGRISTNPFVRREHTSESGAVVRPARFLASSADIRAITRPSGDAARLEAAISSAAAPHLAKVMGSEQESGKPFVLSELARKNALVMPVGTQPLEVSHNSMPGSPNHSTDSTASPEPVAPHLIRTGGAGQRTSESVMATQFVASENQLARNGNSLGESGPRGGFATPQMQQPQIQGRSLFQQNLAGNADVSGMEKGDTLTWPNGEISHITPDGEIPAAVQTSALMANRTEIDSLAFPHETALQTAGAFRTGSESLETGLFPGTAATDQTGSLSSHEIELGSQARVIGGNVRDGLQVKKGLEGAAVTAEKSDDIALLRLPGRHLHAGSSPVSAARIVVPSEATPVRSDAASEAVKPGVFRFPALDRGGMVDAQQTERMVSTKDNKPDLDLAGKNMPNFGKNDSPSRSALQVPAASEPNRTRLEFPSDRMAELAIGSNLLLDKAEDSRALAEPAGSVRNEMAARLTERIWSAVETFRSAGSKDWIVRIRPDEGMELNLRMKIQENQLVIHARLDSGNWDVVAPSWRDLQAQLASRGVQLQPLEGSGGQGSFSQQQQNPMNSESYDQRQFTEEDRRNASDLREMDFRFGAEVSERKKPQLTTKPLILGNGWESWA